MHLAAHLAALIAVVSTGVVYGTDVFCALVQRPALARVDDATLTAVMGNVHRFGDQRLPVPGILGIIASAAACVLAALAGRTRRISHRRSRAGTADRLVRDAREYRRRSMDVMTRSMLTGAERDLLRATSDGKLAKLDEDELIDLHTRVAERGRSTSGSTGAGARHRSPPTGPVPGRPARRAARR